jgi:hypothetical protein
MKTFNRKMGLAVVKHHDALQGCGLTRTVRHRFLGIVVSGCLVFPGGFAGTQETPPPALGGMWSTTVTAIQQPGWTIQDLFACNCTEETYELLEELLLPENDHMSADEIQRALSNHNRAAIQELFTDTQTEYLAGYDHADDPSIQCEYFGTFRTILHNDPILIDQNEVRIILRTEDMASDRIIYVDGRDHPENGPLSPLGHSIGWYEGSTLVVDTVNVAANIAEDALNIHNADYASSIERYTLSEDGQRLHMQFTLIDPVMFREPLVLERSRIFTPDVDLLDAPCESISGEL